MKQIAGTLSAAPFVAILTFALFFVLPRQFQLITFAIPAIYSCAVFSKNGRGFNVKMFFFIMLAAFLVPSGFLTLDVSGNSIIPAVRPTLNVIFSVLDFVNIFVVVFVFVIPVGMLVLIVIDIINPLTAVRYDSVMSTLMKIVLVIFIFFISCTILDLFGLIPEWFVWHYIRDFIIWMIQIFAFLGQSIQALFTGQPFPPAPAFPNLGGQSLGQIAGNADSLFPTLSATGDVSVGSLPWVCVNVSAAIPLILAVIVFGIWAMEQRNRKPYLWINKYLGEEEEDLKIKLVKFNGPAVVFGSIVLVYAFFTFLSFSDSTMDLGLYTVITSFCLILIIIGILPVKTGNFIKTGEGTLIGVGGVFFFYNVLTTGLSTSTFADKDVLVKVLDQVFFTAPTESLIFHVAIPGISLLACYYIYRHYRDKRAGEKVDDRITRLQSQQDYYREVLNQLNIANGKTILIQKKRYSRDELSTLIFNTENEIKVLERKQAKGGPVSFNDLMFSRVQYTAFIIVFVFIIPNVIFSSFHSIRSNYDLLSFWANGVGFVYLGSGCWLTFIAIRYGWLPCILSHALINIISILLLGVYV